MYIIYNPMFKNALVFVGKHKAHFVNGIFKTNDAELAEAFSSRYKVEKVGAPKPDIEEAVVKVEKVGAPKPDIEEAVVKAESKAKPKRRKQAGSK